MVKYLNNRGSKRRTNHQQNGEVSPGPDQQRSGKAGGNDPAQGVTAQEVTAQDQPASHLVSTLWQRVKSLITYQPTETDDTFSLGGRRVEDNPNEKQPDLSAENTLGGEQEPPAAAESDYSSNGGTNSSAASQHGKGDAPSESDQRGRDAGGGSSKQAAREVSGQARPQHGAGEQSRENRVRDPGQSREVQQHSGEKTLPSGGQPSPPHSAPFYQQEFSPASRQDSVEHTQQGGTPPGEQPVPVEQQVHFDLDKNLEHVKRTFAIPTNKSFTIREFLVDFSPPRRAFILFTEGLADKTVIDRHILQPLMMQNPLQDYFPTDPIQLAKARLVMANQVEEKRNFIEVTEGVLVGSTALFIDGSNAALLMETKGWEHRSVGRPLSENVVRGPQEGFNEVLISSVALVRSRLRTEKLISEMFTVGRISKADVAVMYLGDVANPALVQEVRRRLSALNEVDYIPDTGILEQFIEDSSFSPTPQILSTERPDRVAAYLAEGHVALVMSSSPFALIVPTTFWSMLHSAEDHYVRWPYGALMRLVRVTALLIAFLLPAVYIAVTNYHSTMLPPDLLYAIAASRERVPFPTVIEIMIMELSFELIREAGIRIPSLIGPTIGIVGALILGQAAVQANLITPIVIIITAFTGLSSFAIPNYNLSFQVRLLRFVYIIFATIGGFFGIAVLMVSHVAVLCSSNSFGVPILSPAAPNRPSKDIILRGPVWAQETRPYMVRPLQQRRQPEVSQGWNPRSFSKRRGSND